MLLAAFAAAGVLAEFGQDAEGALGMQEGDLRVVGAGDGRVVQHGKACFLGLGDISGDVIGLESDVVDAFSTDGLLKKFGLTVLEDDQHFFPPYYAVPVIRSEVLEAHPELEDLLGQLGAVLTDDVMGTLNYQVDEENQDPETVAKNFLQEQGLIA